MGLMNVFAARCACLEPAGRLIKIISSGVLNLPSGLEKVPALQREYMSKGLGSVLISGFLKSYVTATC